MICSVAAAGSIAVLLLLDLKKPGALLINLRWMCVVVSPLYVWLRLGDQRFGQFEESRVDIDTSLGAGQVHFDPCSRLELIDFLLGNFRLLFLLGNKVVFVPDHDNFNVGLTVLLDFFEPDIEIGEGLLLHQVEAEDDTLRTFVVRIRNCPVPLLACGIPNLQLDLAPAVI